MVGPLNFDIRKFYCIFHFCVHISELCVTKWTSETYVRLVCCLGFLFELETMWMNWLRWSWWSWMNHVAGLLFLCVIWTINQSGHSWYRLQFFQTTKMAVTRTWGTSRFTLQFRTFWLCEIQHSQAQKCRSTAAFGRGNIRGTAERGWPDNGVGEQPVHCSCVQFWMAGRWVYPVYKQQMGGQLSRVQIAEKTYEGVTR